MGSNQIQVKVRILDVGEKHENWIGRGTSTVPSILCLTQAKTNQATTFRA